MKPSKRSNVVNGVGWTPSSRPSYGADDKLRRLYWKCPLTLIIVFNNSFLQAVLLLIPTFFLILYSLTKIWQLINSNCLGVSKTQTSKTQTPDPKNSDPRVSRKLRPKKLRPSGVSKTQTRKIKHIYTAWMPQADLFTVRRYSGITNICREKKKQLAVLHTCNDHENYSQHLYIFFFSLSYKPSLYP